MTEENKKLYDKIKIQKDFKVEQNGQIINILFLNGFIIFDDVKVNLDMYNNIQTEQDYLDLIMDIKNCLSYTLKIKECSFMQSKTKSIA
ncbi:Uncharacterised protein [Sebaldella termitidis]|uniref:Uncharacterized protein n=1 Tax=Sebaldella termitidis (strain ATCC 33386 / NCTC 11300) TaxID=526218 RepID=D1AS51_SEBTE|nr:hypothetical protein [Sebaldella termitidis]ACZ11038.1 hypothetical protein Sterm_4210 [Sebaldella termitidis ATCC 33386]SUI82525.1 Uncharacterised protein [Sebaldella termitidis]